MSLYHLKVLVVSLALAAAGGIVGGVVFAWLDHRSVYYGVGTGLFIVSLICLGLGLLGATEPNEGWRRSAQGRRSLVARVATEHPDIERVSSIELFVWGLVVGGGLMAASFVAYAWAGR